MSYRVPIGPYHVALDEPYKIEVDCEGETIVDAHIKVGFNFRGIEWLALRKNMTRCIALMERVCGICSNVHSMTFCMALERIGSIEVPKRAQYIRMVVAELERLHSHLLWAGVASELIGFETAFMQLFRFRERVMDLLEGISGNRVNYSMNCIGGVNRDIIDPTSMAAAVREIQEKVIGVLIPFFTHDRSVSARCRGVGILSHGDAIRYGAVGPVARASGMDTDLRRDHGYLAYDQVEFAVPLQTEGDVLARVVVRALEIVESCKIIEQAVAQMPPGSLNAGDIYAVPPGEAVMRIEAPRGEVFYYVETNGSDVPSRVKVRTPTFANIPTVMAMIKGNEFADMPLIQAALDPCYSCTDR